MIHNKDPANREHNRLSRVQSINEERSRQLYTLQTSNDIIKNIIKMQGLRRGKHNNSVNVSPILQQHQEYSKDGDAKWDRNSKGADDAFTPQMPYSLQSPRTKNHASFLVSPSQQCEDENMFLRDDRSGMTEHQLVNKKGRFMTIDANSHYSIRYDLHEDADYESQRVRKALLKHQWNMQKWEDTMKDIE